ncbi:hypothetical protein FXO37_24290 [Capsicum annuum]|nr:hypothetical protein FXO37_24290 [Capsicum annuum]
MTVVKTCFCMNIKDVVLELAEGGIVGIKDLVRPEVREFVALCRSAGVNVRMVTGDNINTATAIARECGILTDPGIAIEGTILRDKSQEEMLNLIPKIQMKKATKKMKTKNNALISGFCKAYRVSKAVSLYEDMQARGLNPDEMTFKLIIGGLVHEKNLSTACAVWDQMMEKGFTLDRELSQTLINAINS